VGWSRAHLVEIVQKLVIRFSESRRPAMQRKRAATATLGMQDYDWGAVIYVYFPKQKPPVQRIHLARKCAKLDWVVNDDFH
jgi:hypothetical protein